MMNMLLDELDRGDKSMYSDSMEARVHSQQDVTIEHADTIMNYQASHRFATIDHRKDVKELVFHSYLSFSDVFHGFLKPNFSQMGTYVDCNVTYCKSERPSVDSKM